MAGYVQAEHCKNLPHRCGVVVRTPALPSSPDVVNGAASLWQSRLVANSTVDASTRIASQVAQQDHWPGSAPSRYLDCCN